MAYDPYLVNRIKGAVRARDLTKVEELWIELQSSTPLEDLDLFFGIAAEVAERGDRERAAELLLLLRDDLKEADRGQDLFRVLRQAVRYSGKVRGIRDDLVAEYRRAYGDRPGFDAVLSKSDLAGEGKLRQAVETLDQAFAFEVGDFVYHARGWGIGKVVEAHPESGEFVIDFARRRGQRMEAGMALKALERRGPDDIDVLLWTDKEQVKTMAEEDPLGLLRSALHAANGKLQSRDLREKLAGVVEKTAWTKFWSKARKLAKDDPRIEVGPAPRSVISLRDEPLSRDAEIVEKLRKQRDFRKRLDLAQSELSSVLRDGTSDGVPEWIGPALEFLQKNHGKKGTVPHAAASIELAIFQDDVARRWPEAVPGIEVAAENAVDPDTGEPLPDAVSEHVREVVAGISGRDLIKVLDAMAVNEYRKRVVQLLPRTHGEQATELLQAVLLEPPAHTWMAAIRALKELGRDELITDTANQIVIKPQDFPEAYSALAKARLSGNLEVLPERSEADILGKAIQVLDTLALQQRETQDKKEKASLKNTVDSLRTVLSDKNARVLARVIGEGSEDDVKRILQLVRQSPALSDTIRRVTETLVAERYPELLVRHKGIEEEEDVLFSTVEGKRRREAELHKLMTEDFEKNRQAIGRALEFGDISENSELDEARREQQMLAERIERIRVELEKVRILDPATVETDVTGVGARVTVESLETNEETSYTILGPWDVDDSDPSIISHLSPLAQGLLGHKVGDEVEVKLPDGSTAKYRVKAIEKGVLQEQES